MLKKGDRVRLVKPDQLDRVNGLGAGSTGTCLESHSVPRVKWDDGETRPIIDDQVMLIRIYKNTKRTLKCLCNWVKYRGKYVRRWDKACKVHKQ